jgi:hypothetical protein
MNKSAKNVVILLASIFILGSGTLVFADRYKGCGYQGTMHPGQGRHHQRYGGPGYGNFGNFSEEEIKKLNEEHTAFMEATKDLQRQIYQKQLELASELAKQNPDATAAATLQQEISNVLAQLAQMHLEHFLRVQKINPDTGRGGPKGFWMMGHGMMHHDMMGPDAYGGWDRPDCPFGGPGCGYGRRSGMMDPGYGRGAGMIGPGRSRGMGPGMMNRDGFRRFHDALIAPAEKNAGASEEN